MAKGFFSPKLTLNVGDGFEFMKKNQIAFDVIITDSSDPVGKQRKTSHLTLIFNISPWVVMTSPSALFNSLLLVVFVLLGPAESLFKESYYQLMKTALRDGGILCCQG